MRRIWAIFHWLTSYMWWGAYSSRTLGTSLLMSPLSQLSTSQTSHSSKRHVATFSGTSRPLPFRARGESIALCFTRLRAGGGPVTSNFTWIGCWPPVKMESSFMQFRWTSSTTLTWAMRLHAPHRSFGIAVLTIPGLLASLEARRARLGAKLAELPLTMPPIAPDQGLSGLQRHFGDWMLWGWRSLRRFLWAMIYSSSPLSVCTVWRCVVELAG